MLGIVALLAGGISVAPLFCETPTAPATLNRRSVPAMLFRAPAAQKATWVKPFLLDRFAVTNADYARFVSMHTEWRRGNVKSLFVDEGYLRHWPSATGSAREESDSPVTNVSWFAARAYCRAQSGRLPTLLEWERAAAEPMIVHSHQGERPQPQSIESLVLAWYEKTSPAALPRIGSTYENRLGLYDLHGLIWEWVEDFNALPISSDSRGGIDRALFCAGGAAAGINAADYAAYMRYAFRSSLQARFSVQNLGFRCASDAGGRP